VCAAIGRTTEDTFSSMNMNCNMMKNIISHHYKNGIKGIIFLSSVDIYGRPPKRLPITENSYPVADTYYGMSKYVSEKILLKEMSTLCPVTILRLPGVYGYQDRFHSIIGRFINQSLEKNEIVIFGDGLQQRDYIEVTDVCNTIKNFIEKPETTVVNLVTGKSYSLNEVAKIVCNTVSRFNMVTIKHLDQCSEDNFDLIFDNEKLFNFTNPCDFILPNDGIVGYVESINIR